MGEGVVVEWPGGRRLLEALVFWRHGIRSHLGAIRKGGLENPAVSKKGAGEQGVLCSVALQKQPFFTEGLARGGCGGEGAGAYGTGDLRVVASVGDGVRSGGKGGGVQVQPNPDQS